jgi:ubiquinol-cytochrome c reductase iron-sulfur subunit
METLRPETGHAEERPLVLPKVMTGTHGPEDGAGLGTPWPDDVPPEQDDSWFPLRDDPWRARRMEYIIAALWCVTGGCGIGLMIAYWTGGEAQVEGALLAAAFGCLGAGLLLWARYLIPGQGEIVGSRGSHESDPQERAAVVASLSRGTDAMMSRRGFLVKKVLVPMGGIFGVAALWPIASLGPRYGRTLYHTAWYAGARLVDQFGNPVLASDVAVDGILTVFPEGHTDTDLPENAMSPAVLINIGGASIQERPISEGFEARYGGNVLVCFSKICTHAGCAVSLFNVLSLQLVCPCHQSTFDILEDCKPVFGPASRPLPQLPIGVGPDGYLFARGDFKEPVGPGFWNRGGPA